MPAPIASMRRADSTTSTSMPGVVQAERGREAADPAAGDEDPHGQRGASEAGGRELLVDDHQRPPAAR